MWPRVGVARPGPYHPAGPPELDGPYSVAPQENGRARMKTTLDLDHLFGKRVEWRVIRGGATVTRFAQGCLRA